MVRREVVVGVDGSAQSDAAVAWAVAEARARGCGLQIVHCCESRNYGLWTTTKTLREGLRQMARPLIDRALALAARLDPDIPADGRVLVASPAHTLVRLSARASLVVVGRNGRGAISRLPLGSVARHVMANTTCPVVGVGCPRDDVAVGTTSRIIAAIDHPAGHELTLHFAFGEALLHHVPMRVASALPRARLPGAPARRQLGASLISWQAQYPAVDVTSSVHVGDLVDALESLCTPRDLLVLGHHQHGPLILSALGAHTTAAMRVAPCPIAVVQEPTHAQVAVPTGMGEPCPRTATTSRGQRPPFAVA
jgi:nucleotide-binding universal stress UspA family protein